MFNVKPSVFFLTSFLFILAAMPASGFFVLTENFDDFQQGPVSGQFGWYSTTGSGLIVEDPFSAGNNVLAVVTNSAIVRGPASILQGSARMMYLRFMFAGRQNYSFGLSHLNYPSEFSDFKPEISMTNSSNELRVNDGGTYDTIILLEPNIWYNLWVMVDNQTNQYEMWLNSTPYAAATDDDKMISDDSETLFDFRAGGSHDLVKFYIKTGGGNSDNSGPLYIDDIYIEDTDARNLLNPVCTAADITGDCFVDLLDFSMLGETWLLSSGQSGYNDKCDLIGDNMIDLEDLKIFALYWLEGIISQPRL